MKRRPPNAAFGLLGGARAEHDQQPDREDQRPEQDHRLAQQQLELGDEQAREAAAPLLRRLACGGRVASSSRLRRRCGAASSASASAVSATKASSSVDCSTRVCSGTIRSCTSSAITAATTSPSALDHDAAALLAGPRAPPGSARSWSRSSAGRCPEADPLAESGAEVGGGVDRADAAVVQQRDAVAEILGLLHEVRDEDHRQALVADALDQLPGLATRLRVEAGRQLVEDRELRDGRPARARSTGAGAGRRRG